jgi:hypothetical protein
LGVAEEQESEEAASAPATDVQNTTDGQNAPESFTRPGSNARLTAFLQRDIRGRPGVTPASVAAVVVAVGLSLWFTADVWGPHAPAGDDVAARLANTEFAIDHLLSEGRPDGWQPIFGLGYQQFLFLGPGLAVLVGAVQLLSLGFLSVAGAFKVVTVGSFVALPLAVAFMARSFALSHRAAGLAAILVLGISGTQAGFGLHNLFGIGLITNQVGAVPFFIALGCAVRQLAHPHRRWILLTGIATAALILVHIVSALVLGLLLGVIVLLDNFEWSSLNARSARGGEPLGSGEQLALFPSLPPPGTADPAQDSGDAGEPGDEASRGRFGSVPRLIGPALVALGLAAFMLVPLLAHRDLQGTYTGYSVPPLGERLRGLRQGEAVLAPGLGTWLLAGLAYGALRVIWRRRFALTILLAPFVCLLVAYAAFRRWPESLVTAQLPIRSLGYLVMLALLPLATLLAWVGRIAGRWGPLGAVAAAGALVVLTVSHRDLVGESEPAAQLREAAGQLAERVPDGARFATQRDFPAEIAATGVSHPDFWLPWLSGRNTLNIFNAESSFPVSPVFEPERIGTKAAEDSADALSRLGVTHVVLVNEAEASDLLASSRFELVWRLPPLAILEVKAPVGQPHPASLLSTGEPADARLIEAQAEHVVIELSTEEDTSTSVAVAYSPKWQARLDGSEVTLGHTEDGLLALDVPAGDHVLELDFKADGWDVLGVALTLISVLVMVVWWQASRRSSASSVG